jgi:hypothetical protein
VPFLRRDRQILDCAYSGALKTILC